MQAKPRLFRRLHHRCRKQRPLLRRVSNAARPASTRRKSVGAARHAVRAADSAPIRPDPYWPRIHSRTPSTPERRRNAKRSRSAASAPFGSPNPKAWISATLNRSSPSTGVPMLRANPIRFTSTIPVDGNNPAGSCTARRETRPASPAKL